MGNIPEKKQIEMKCDFLLPILCLNNWKTKDICSLKLSVGVWNVRLTYVCFIANSLMITV